MPEKKPTHEQKNTQIIVKTVCVSLLISVLSIPAYVIILIIFPNISIPSDVWGILRISIIGMSVYLVGYSGGAMPNLYKMYKQ